jgi:hypothetical protein
MRRKPPAPVGAVLAAILVTSVPAYGTADHPRARWPRAESSLSTRLTRLTDLATRPSPGLQIRRTARLDTARFETLGAMWRGDSALEVTVRTHAHGSWSRWRELHPETHAPAVAADHTAADSDWSATEPLWVGPSDGVQVRVHGADPERLSLALIDPGTLATDRLPATGAPAVAPVPDDANPTMAPQPKIRTRRAWGARESWRRGSPRYNATIKQAHIHHTAGTNRYTRSDVPAIIRGDYWYHTQVLGWSDLGYNFVVDKFGRIWEGRAGGIRRAVVGAHTLGFNHASVGVAAIGNFEAAKTRPRLLRALVRLTAWKLDMYGRRPAGKTVMTSRGSDRYRRGQRVILPVIDGHRDTNLTVCPGGRLYAKLPLIRRRAQHRADSVFLPGPLTASRPLRLP